MDESQRAFVKRHQALQKKHARLSKGYITKMDRSGLITHQPDSKVAGMGLRLAMIAIAGFLMFKGFVLAGLGEDQYLTHLAALQQGSGFEQAGAFLMQIDPASAGLATLLQPMVQDGGALRLAAN
ncbi:MAG: hypothetical protein N4A53_05365 [Pelagimonas sp.]|jgi:hypothetical protein|nr:hypothetical protein [Pelagimonas sp.]